MSVFFDMQSDTRDLPCSLSQCPQTVISPPCVEEKYIFMHRLLEYIHAYIYIYMHRLLDTLYMHRLLDTLVVIYMLLPDCEISRFVKCLKISVNS